MKNTAQRTQEEIEIEPGFLLLKCHNLTEVPQTIKRPIDSTFIQLHFGLGKESQLIFSGGHYVMPVSEGNSTLLYNPNKDLDLNLVLPPKAKFITLIVSIDRFHRFFSEEAGLIHFLDAQHRNDKYYFKKEMTPKELVVLNEMFNAHLRPSLESLFLKGKVYELLSLYFNKTEETDACPFLKDEKNVEKIRLAKSIIIERVAEPPTLTELASEVGLSLKKLKDGFKQIYGDSVFSFLFEYKMDLARTLIESQKYNVSEISEMIGYSAPSHFISAFKQKFGTTPKQFMKG